MHIISIPKRLSSTKPKLQLILARYFRGIFWLVFSIQLHQSKLQIKLSNEKREKYKNSQSKIFILGPLKRPNSRACETAQFSGQWCIPLTGNRKWFSHMASNNEGIHSKILKYYVYLDGCSITDPFRRGFISFQAAGDRINACYLSLKRPFLESDQKHSMILEIF